MSVNVPDWVLGCAGSFPIAGSIILLILKSKADSLYMRIPTPEQKEKEEKSHEEKMILICDDAYVRRKRYHEDMDKLTGELQCVRVDVQKGQVAISVLGERVETLTEIAKDQTAFLRQISLDVASINGSWSEWKNHEPFMVVRDRIVGQASTEDIKRAQTL